MSIVDSNRIYLNFYKGNTNNRHLKYQPNTEVLKVINWLLTFREKHSLFTERIMQERSN